jgi:hypothetical protein
LVDFKEASFIQGKLIRITKKKMEILLDDEETGEPALATVKLADDVAVDLDTVGEEVKAIIVDGKVARITALAPNPGGPPGKSNHIGRRRLLSEDPSAISCVSHISTVRTDMCSQYGQFKAGC